MGYQIRTTLCTRKYMHKRIVRVTQIVIVVVGVPANQYAMEAAVEEHLEEAPRKQMRKEDVPVLIMGVFGIISHNLMMVVFMLQ